MPFKIVRNDITKMPVDAIVNAANTALRMGSGVCGAIFSATGAEKLQKECNALGDCETGEAVITRGYNLTAKYIIHTVGPIWRGGSFEEEKLLRSSYINSLKLAMDNKCSSIAFPLISSGIFGYPKDQALSVAVSAIGEFLKDHDIMVYLVVYDKKSYILSEKLFSAIERYIDDNYIDEHSYLEWDRSDSYNMYDFKNIMEKDIPFEGVSAPMPMESASEPMPMQKGKRSLEDVMSELDETFSQMLLRLIDEKGITDVEAYKRANIDRKLFSKIRSNKGYNPSKVTAIAFAISLRLSLDETLDLLNKAGYTLSHSNKFDVIIEYFIREGSYNIHEINEALFAYDQDLLGA